MEIIIFENVEFGKVRTIEKDGQVWFVGKDVANILGYANTRKAIIDHVDEEDKGVTECDTRGGKQGMIFINESGLYSLILSSKLPTAKKFKRWVTSEVLPSTRKNGVYATEEMIEKSLENPDYIIAILQKLKKERETSKQLATENAIMKPKAEYFDELVDRRLLTNIRDTAKILKIKERKFVTFLVESKFLYRDNHAKLRPYAEYVNNGLFEIKERYSEANSWAGIQTFVTPKGVETFRLLLKRRVSIEN